MQTRVCRLHAAHDLRIDTFDLPEPGPGEVMVRLGAGGICGSDLHYFHEGGFGPVRVREPIVLGHEAAGTVERAGPGVSLAPGTKVALNPSRPCMACAFCGKGAFNHCLSMRFSGSAMRLPHEQGFFRERITLPAAQCVPVSDSLGLDRAACAEPLAVCLHARRQAGALTGARVLVTGSGPIGVLCAAVARDGGAAEIVVTDIEDAPLAVARAMGATRTVNVARDPGAMEAFAEDKGRIDVTFECSAAPSAIRGALSCTRPQGTIVQVGVTGDAAVPLNMLVAKEIVWRGTHRFHAEFAEAVAMIAQSRIDVGPMISAAYPMDRALEAFAAAGDRTRAVKVQIAF
jgi:L-idonate 5-dehydrogenase